MVISENDSLLVLARIKLRSTEEIIGKRHEIHLKKMELIEKWMKGEIATEVYNKQISECDGLFAALSWAISLDSTLNYEQKEDQIFSIDDHVFVNSERIKGAKGKVVRIFQAGMLCSEIIYQVNYEMVGGNTTTGQFKASELSPIK